MNILHLKYAVEVAATGSINKAAENLYMGQPNLSRAIRELEENLGITIFDRTPKGICVTDKGREFLHYARKILQQIDAVEKIYKYGNDEKSSFSVCVPKASYISHAFTEFSKTLNMKETTDVCFIEGDLKHTVNSVARSDCNLGIIRYNINSDNSIKSILDGKGVSYETVNEFKYAVVIHKSHPLAKRDRVSLDDLKTYTEIVCGDSSAQSAIVSGFGQEEIGTSKKRICVSDRATLFDLLSVIEGAFARTSSMPEDILEKYGLVEKTCTGDSDRYKDVLIYRNNYKFTALDRRFAEAIKGSTD